MKPKVIFIGKKNKNKIKMAKWSKLIKLKKILAHHFRAPGEVVMGQHDSSLGPVGARGVQHVATMIDRDASEAIVEFAVRQITTNV